MSCTMVGFFFKWILIHLNRKGTNWNDVHTASKLHANSGLVAREITKSGDHGFLESGKKSANSVNFRWAIGPFTYFPIYCRIYKASMLLNKSKKPLLTQISTSFVISNREGINSNGLLKDCNANGGSRRHEKEATRREPVMVGSEKSVKDHNNLR